MAEKIPLKKYQKRLQNLLDEISTTGPENRARFNILKRKAKKVLAKMREEYPELQRIPLQQPHGER